MMKLVTFRELKTIYGVPYCRQHLSRLEAAEQFPTRVTLGQCRVAWVASEIEAWIEDRLAKRTAPST